MFFLKKENNRNVFVNKTFPKTDKSSNVVWFFFSHISQNKKHCPYDAPMPYKINFPPKHFHHVLTSHLQNHSSTICLALALSVVDHEPMKNHHFFSLFQKMIFFYNTQTHKKTSFSSILFSLSFYSYVEMM